MEIPPPSSAPPRWTRPVAAAGILALAALVWVYVASVRSQQTIGGLRLGGQPMGGIAFSQLEPAMGAAIERFLDGKIAFVFGKEQIEASRRDAGFTVDRAEAVRLAKEAGKSGNPFKDLAMRSRARRGKVDLDLPVEISRKKALEFLTELKDDVDRAGTDARLDLEAHTIAPGRPGYLLRVYDSMVALEYAARAGASSIELSAAVTEPKITEKDLTGIEIGAVLGFWETRYSVSAIDSDRTYNLKVGADHLNGHILKPHEVFSFNEVVGDRTEREGYRVAPVISAGELIDGLAGGMCQIASTLHAAAYFAGLEIVHSSPHSRPSAYITMGLDSTVVYPTTDLKLRNPYDFPVVMHYQVNQGSVKVELLGKERPYKVLFEREIKTETPFATEERPDPEMPEGQRLTLQEGYNGYTLIRRRYVFEKDAVPRWYGPELTAEMLHRQHKKPVSRQQWALKYPPTSMIVAVGTGLPTLKQKPPPPTHKIPPLSPKDKPVFKMLK